MSRGACRFLCDENVNRKLVEALRRQGIDAVHVLDLDLMSADDMEIMAVAITSDRILLTRDYTDFGTLIRLYNLQDIEFPGIDGLAQKIVHEPGLLMIDRHIGRIRFQRIGYGQLKIDIRIGNGIH